MGNKAKGAVCGVVAAITYGLNPLGALNLYRDGVNVDSVLFHRYCLAVLIVAGLMALRKESFVVARRELMIAAVLGVIFAISSLALFTSFHYMDAGLACTILFLYPIMVAFIMAAFFREKTTLFMALAILLAMGGIGLLYEGDEGTTLSMVGVLLGVLSGLAYAVYIVVVNQARLRLPPLTLTFFVMLFGALTVLAHSRFDEANQIRLLTTLPQWLWALLLAVVPTVISLVLMVIAVRNIGSTPTAVMGALEPVTAVAIGVLAFHEAFTPRIALGMALILLAVFLIILEKPLSAKLRRKKEV